MIGDGPWRGHGACGAMRPVAGGVGAGVAMLLRLNQGLLANLRASVFVASPLLTSLLSAAIAKPG